MLCSLHYLCLLTSLFMSSHFTRYTNILHALACTFFYTYHPVFIWCRQLNPYFIPLNPKLALLLHAHATRDQLWISKQGEPTKVQQPVILSHPHNMVTAKITVGLPIFSLFFLLFFYVFSCVFIDQLMRSFRPSPQHNLTVVNRKTGQYLLEITEVSHTSLSLNSAS